MNLGSAEPCGRLSAPPPHHEGPSEALRVGPCGQPRRCSIFNLRCYPQIPALCNPLCSPRGAARGEGARAFASLLMELPLSLIRPAVFHLIDLALLRNTKSGLSEGLVDFGGCLGDGAHLVSNVGGELCMS